ncbi:MAG: hypothetical protein ACRDRL_16555 [Sciscionella sp.]
MLIIDDANLLAVLADIEPADVRSAVDSGEVLTTGSWYWRLARAIRETGTTGALTRAYEALAPDQRDRVDRSLELLPSQIGLFSSRRLVPIMTALVTPRRVNFLTAEALATALLTDATIVVGSDSHLMNEAADSLGLTVRRSGP